MNKTTIEIDDIGAVECKGEILIENDGIGSYEYWGQKCYDKGHNYPMIEEIFFDHFLYAPDQITVISKCIEENFDIIAVAIIDDYQREMENERVYKTLP